MTIREIFYRVFVVVLIVTLVHGCTSDAGAPDVVCTSNLECPSGWRCNQNRNQCEKISKPEVVVDIELTPQTVTSSAATQFAKIDLAEVDSEIDFELDRAVPFTGRVSAPIASAGSLTLRRNPEFDDQRLSWNFLVSEDGQFTSRLGFDKNNPNQYEAIFRPTNRKELPQLQCTHIGIESVDGLAISLTYPTYPAPDQLDNQGHLLMVKLRVLQTEMLQHPVANIVIEGITDLGLRTNLAVPDIRGEAFLRMPIRYRFDTQEVQYPTSLKLIMRPADSSIRLPTVQTEVELKDYDLGTIYMGATPDSQIVTGTVVDSEGQTIANCDLYFRSDKIGQGSYERILETDAKGNFSTTLPQGRYVLVAAPDLGLQAGLSSWQIEVKPGLEQLDLTLQDRLQITGYVYDHDGVRVPGVTVRADRLGDQDGLADGIRRFFEVVSTSAGYFSLFLDPGMYNLTLTPAADCHLPMLIQRGLRFETSHILTAQETTLPRPTIITGNIFNYVGSTHVWC